MSLPQRPSALLFIGTGCPHCLAVLTGLTRLIKDGHLSRLEVVNLEAEPERARELGIQSVPWTRIGPFELVGALSPSQLADWVECAAAGDGWTAYFSHLLETQRLEQVVQRIRNYPSTMTDLLNLLADEETPMGVRIAVSAVVEDLAGEPVLEGAVAELEPLTLSSLARTRADACHFLGLTGSPRALPAVRRLLDDESPDVREIALESLAMLGETREDELADRVCS